MCQHKYLLQGRSKVWGRMLMHWAQKWRVNSFWIRRSTDPWALLLLLSFYWLFDDKHIFIASWLLVVLNFNGLVYVPSLRSELSMLMKNWLLKIVATLLFIILFKPYIFKICISIYPTLWSNFWKVTSVLPYFLYIILILCQKQTRVFSSLDSLICFECCN